MLAGGDLKPSEINTFENGTLKQLTHQNDALLNELEIAVTEEVNFKSKDGRR